MQPSSIYGSRTTKESSIPRFFFPRKRTPFVSDERIRCERVVARLDAVILSSTELSQLVEYICSFACKSDLPLDVKQEVKRRSKKTGIVRVDRLLDLQMTLMLSYDDFSSISKSSWCSSLSFLAKLKIFLSPTHFLMFTQDSTEKINGFTILEYIHQLQLSLCVARFLKKKVAQGGGIGSEMLSEKTYMDLITDTIDTSSREIGLFNGDDFKQYYQLICARMLLFPHGVQQVRTGGLSIHRVVTCSRFADFFKLMDSTLRERYDVQKNPFHPIQIRNIHRQYLQLDSDGNGMLSTKELEDYGKKRAFNCAGNEPTYDLTKAFVTQVFAEVTMFTNEMDYHAYLDFTLLINDQNSVAALRFFWSVLDFQKQGYLDAFTLDFFLRSLLEKIITYEGKDDAPTIDRLRAQVFDAVALVRSSRITWQDLLRCKLGHDVVRLIIDYVAYRAYEDIGGRFADQS